MVLGVCGAAALLVAFGALLLAVFEVLLAVYVAVTGD